MTGLPSLDYRNAFVRFADLFDFPSRTDAALLSGLLPHSSLESCSGRWRWLGRS